MSLIFSPKDIVNLKNEIEKRQKDESPGQKAESNNESNIMISNEHAISEPATVQS